MSSSSTTTRTRQAWAKTQRGAERAKELQCDRGGEYMSDEFKSYLEGEGTIRRLTVHDSPQQNGTAERLNRTLTEHARAMLLEASLPKFVWGEAVSHAVWLRNRTTTRNTPGTTPHELATGVKPNLAGLPRFGATVWVRIDAPSKLDAKAKRGRWVGLDPQSKGHRIYWPDKRTVGVERDVRFEPTPSDRGVNVLLEGEDLHIEQHPSPAPNERHPPENGTTSTAPIPTQAVEDIPDRDRDVPPHVETERRTQRVRKPSQWVRDLQSGAGTTGG